MFTQGGSVSSTYAGADVAGDINFDTAGVSVEQPSETDGQAQHRETLAGLQAEIHRFVASRINDKAEAEDISQEALCLAIQRLDSFRGDNIRAWLFTIARNLIIDRYRSRGRVHFAEIDDEQLHGTEPALQTRPKSGSPAGDRVQRCLNCITAFLPDKEQATVLLSDVYGFADKKSAVLLGMTVPSFKFRLHKARVRLQYYAIDGCALLGKTGVPNSCPGCADGRGLRSGSEPRELPPGSSDKTLAALRQELIDALGMDVTPDAKQDL
jgi:RNA polymerase sigma-70 factor, ECF subfamily